MTDGNELRYGLLRGAGLGAVKLTYALDYTAGATRRFIGAALHEAMRPEERERFSVELYDRSVQAKEARRGLPPWEAAWLHRDLPKPPASLLLAGAGTGREAIPLLESGYSIRAFDASARSVAICERMMRGRGEVHVGTYRELCEQVERQPTSRPGPMQELVRERYDGAVLGWGSLTHVATRAERRRVLQAIAALTDGPILASFYVDETPMGAQTRRDRATRLGRALGRVAMGRKRTRDDSEATFSSWGGFAEFLTRPEVASLGAAIGRDVRYYHGDAPFPFVTFLPRSRP